MRRAVAASLFALLLSGCGSDSNPTAPQISITGKWVYNATNVAGSGVSCNFGGANFTLTQSGTTFTGTTAGGTISCLANGSTFSSDLGGDVIANGVINGNSVQFDIGTQDIHNVGTLTGSSIAGVVTLRVQTGTTTVILSGNFTAVKQ